MDRLSILRLAFEGALSKLVNQKLPNKPVTGSFRDQFLKLKPGPEREKLVWEEAIRVGPPKKLVPITVTASNGTKITYYVMPDMIMSSDGIRLPLTAIQFQKLADMWHMNLPTNKMVDQIYHHADAKIFAPPLSAGGMIGGKYYSGAEVAAHKIGDSDSKIAYDDMLNKELNKYKDPNLVAGHQKEITSPILDPNKLNFYGWYYKDKPIQDSKQSAHTLNQVEYAASARAVGDEVILTKPDGTTVKTTLQQVLNDPELYKSISDIQGVKKYPT
jgi:hypothetical protein